MFALERAKIGDALYDLAICVAISRRGNCLLRSIAQIIDSSPYDGGLYEADSRIAKLRALTCARHGCTRSCPLRLSERWAPAIECLGRRPSEYTAVFLRALGAVARDVVGDGKTPLILRHNPGQFSPIWCECSSSSLAARMISARPLNDMRKCSGGCYRSPCKCGARCRFPTHHGDKKMCNMCEKKPCILRKRCPVSTNSRGPFGRKVWAAPRNSGRIDDKESHGRSAMKM